MYPEETLRKKLEASGLAWIKHDLESLQKLLRAYFKRPLDDTLKDVNIAAEILIYLHKEEQVSFEDLEASPDFLL